MKRFVIFALTLFSVTLLLSNMVGAGKIVSLTSVDMDELQKAKMANRDVRWVKGQPSAPAPKVIGGGEVSTDGCNRILTKRTLDNPAVNFGFSDNDSGAIWFQAPGDMKVLAARFMPMNMVGNVIVDIFETPYSGYSGDAVDGDGWLSGGTHPTGLTTPLGAHLAGPFPQAITAADSGQWFTIDLSTPLEFSAGDNFCVSLRYQRTAGWGFASEAPYGGTHCFFKYYAPENAQYSPTGDPGWFLRSYVLWYEVVAEILGDIPPDFGDRTILTTTVSTDPRDVCVSVTDVNCSGGPAGVARVYVHYGTWGEFYGQAELTQVGDEWCGQIPGFSPGDMVNYYYSAEDVEGNTSMTLTYNYYIWEFRETILLVYNSEDFPDGIDSYYMLNTVDACGFPYPYDSWHVPTYGPLLVEVVPLYETIIVAEGSYPASGLPIDVIGDWLAAGTPDSPHNFFLSSQGYGCWWYDCLDTDFGPNDFEYDYLGLSTLGPQEVGGGSTDPYPINPVCTDPYYGDLCAHAGQLLYNPVYEIGQQNWIDNLTANAAGSVCFTDPQTGNDCGVHVEGSGFNTVFLPFDVLSLDWLEPEYDWINFYRNMIDAALDQWDVFVSRDKEQSIQDGFAWLVAQQNPDGSWPCLEGNHVAKTAFAVLKLEDRAFEMGYDPFSEEYVYSSNVIAGLNYLFSMAHPVEIGIQPAGDPDSEGDGSAISIWDVRYHTYETSIAMMAIAGSRYPEMTVTAPGAVNGWTYKKVLQNTVDYFAFGQNDEGPARGGWGYVENHQENDEYYSDNSNSGYAVLGLRYAESEQYGFNCTIPSFVKTELDVWINTIQDPVDGNETDGGSYYRPEYDWCNLLETGNLLFEMAFVGDDVSTQRVIDALDYIERHWDTIHSHGWLGNYQAMYCLMKGFESLNIDAIWVDDIERDWFQELVDFITCSQNDDGSWPQDQWGDELLILSTEWALLTLEKVSPVYVGSVAGHVTADSPEPNTGLLGVSINIDAYEEFTGDLVGTAVTDSNGYYQIDNLPVGDYIITIVTPLGYSATADEIFTTVIRGETVIVDLTLTSVDIIANPRSIGFWKHQVGVALGGKGNARVDAVTLCDYLDLIEVHFNSNAINQVVVYEAPASGLCDDKLEVLKGLLNLKGNVDMTSRAKQQLMALLLNVAAEYISLTEVISEDKATASQAITYSDNLIDDQEGDHETAKTVCDEINNNRLVAAGVIPLETMDIAYKLVPASYSLRQNYPNPFNPSTDIRYQIADSRSPHHTTLKIYNILGQEVRTLVDEVREPGYYTVTWDGRDQYGNEVSSGVYFYRLTAAGITATRRMVLMK
ncbi:MAG: T9SS type A sorting domain-containing protein [Gemmatimonadota bacterium]|nr:MAG: T9SS type A sorting domain-containing protein [Gemmatimonadota bacterium]